MITYTTFIFVFFQLPPTLQSSFLICTQYLLTYLLTYLLSYLLTPWCKVLLEELTGLQLVKKFPTFHGTRRFITALTIVRHLSLSWANPIQSTYPHPTSWRSILILSTHLRLGLSSGLLPSGFPTKTLYAPLSSPIRATWPAHLILLDFITRTILGEEYRSFSSSLCSLLHSPRYLEYAHNTWNKSKHRYIPLTFSIIYSIFRWIRRMRKPSNLPGFETPWECDFFTHQAPPCLQCIGYRVSFVGVERQGCVVDHPAFSADILCG